MLPWCPSLSRGFLSPLLFVFLAGSTGNGLEEGEVLSDSEQPATVLLSQNVARHQKPRLRSVASTVQVCTFSFTKNF